MGGIAGGRLARAVAEAGGLGLVGVSYGDQDFIDTQLPLVADTAGSWGVGIVAFTFAAHPELLDHVLSFNPSILALSFGDDEQIKRFIDVGKAAGLLISIQVHDVHGAVLAVEAGADMVIAQGAESGGHHLTHGHPLGILLPDVVDAVGHQVPVAAAGGIVDARSMAAALSMGATSVMVGTRFVAADEALTSPAFAERLLAGGGQDVVETTAFDVIRKIPWNPIYTASALENEFTRTWSGRGADLRAQAPALVGAWNEAVARDDGTQRPMFAGLAVGRVTSRQPAAAIIAELTRGACALLLTTAARISPANRGATGAAENEWVLELDYSGTPEQRLRTRDEHLQWVRSHIEAGEFLLAGAREGGRGGIIITNNLSGDRLHELIDADPWNRQGLVRYNSIGFAAVQRAPGIPRLSDGLVTLINPVQTPSSAGTLDAFTELVSYVARTAEGFLGARLLTSLDGESVVNIAQWASAEQFDALFEDPEFQRLYALVAVTAESTHPRLYLSRRIIQPAPETKRHTPGETTQTQEHKNE
ncbi:nitronate monooxygenase [Mycetocola saprophilus]|uniref:nitronate monooxygenase n=1 Tax=Mycetocola saprophilus TaxID=76636 RepID=UPI003BF20AA8